MWSFEFATLRPGDTGPGLLPARFLTRCFFLLASLALISLILVGPTWGPLLVLGLAGILLARQFALDAAHETLLDLYNLPLLILGLIFSTLWGLGLQSALIGLVAGFVFGLGLAWVVGRIKPGSSGLGGGDVKFLAVMGAWLGPLGLLLAFTLACFMNWLVAVLFNRPSLPQGIGLILALWVMLLVPGVIIHLFLRLADVIA